MHYTINVANMQLVFIVENKKVAQYAKKVLTLKSIRVTISVSHDMRQFKGKEVRK